MVFFNQFQLSEKIKKVFYSIKEYSYANISVIIFLILITIAAYGFELFNLNLTIDEENAAFQASASLWRIENGRWGMFVLNYLVFPFSVISFVPLAVTLIFQLIAILILMETLGIEHKFTKVIGGALGMIWPGMAFMYNFSTTNYGIGIGLFCISLSLWIFNKFQGTKKYLGVLPAAFAIAIYQPLIPALVIVYMIYVVYREYKGYELLRTLSQMAFIMLFSLIAYYAIQKALILFLNIHQSDYMSSHYDFAYLKNNWQWALDKLRRLIFNVYAGDPTVYGIEIRTLPIILLISSIRIFHYILTKKYKLIEKLLAFTIISLILLLPFLGGVFTKGIIPLRSLPGLPFVLSGFMFLGLKERPKRFNIIIALLAFYCVFQFISSSNHLFASSHLALEQDKILGSQLILRIEDEKADNGIKEVNYLEMIGYVNRPSTPLISRIETIGASFFGWDQGNSTRAVRFLSILGYDGLQPLPNERRYEFIPFADEMPAWPAVGSVQVVDDVVLVKFGSYSKTQIESICTSACRSLIRTGFCP